MTDMTDTTTPQPNAPEHVGGSAIPPEELERIAQDIIAALKTVYDPEIPADIYELGLVYKIDIDDNHFVTIDMTLTAPGCPLADYITEDVRQKVSAIEGVTSANVNLVFEPQWDQDMMSEEAKADLGLL